MCAYVSICTVGVSGCLDMGVRVMLVKLTFTGQLTEDSVLLLRNFQMAHIHV